MVNSLGAHGCSQSMGKARGRHHVLILGLGLALVCYRQAGQMSQGLCCAGGMSAGPWVWHHGAAPGQGCECQLLNSLGNSKPLHPSPSAHFILKNSSCPGESVSICLQRMNPSSGLCVGI